MGQARESQSDGRLQNSRWLESGRAAHTRGAPPRRSERQHRQSRPVDRVCLPRSRRARATSIVPVGSNPDKMAAMRALGATVVEYGRDFDEARERVEMLAPREGWRYVHSANEPHLIAGVGTLALEIFDELPDVEAIFTPVGGGSGASGCCIVRSGRGSRARVVGVQASGADAFARSWRGPARVETIASQPLPTAWPRG